MVYYLGRLSRSWDFSVGEKSLVGRGISHNCYINVFLYILPVSYEMNANLRERILFYCSYRGDGTRSLQRCPFAVSLCYLIDIIYFRPRLSIRFALTAVAYLLLFLS